MNALHDQWMLELGACFLLFLIFIAGVDLFSGYAGLALFDVMMGVGAAAVMSSAWLFRQIWRSKHRTIS